MEGGGGWMECEDMGWRGRKGRKTSVPPTRSATVPSIIPFKDGGRARMDRGGGRICRGMATEGGEGTGATDALRNGAEHHAVA